jgi:membrane protease YdiL (CAAX protease family)
MGLGLVWPVECALLVCVGVASLLLTKAGVRSIPGWDVHPIIMSNHAALSAAWTCAVVWFLACHLKRRGLDDGLALRSPGRYWAVWSTLLGVGMAMAGVAVSSQWGREDTTIARMGATPEGLACLGALAMFMAPVEEVYYRGFVFPGLRRSLGAGWAGAIVVTWFASIHVLQLVGAGGFDAASLACVAAAGTVFTVVRQRTDSLLPPIAVHFAYNTTLVAVSALSMILEGAG